MNSPKGSTITIFLASIVLFGCIATSTRSQSSIRLAGSVDDSFDVPITGARITLYSPERILQATSDSSGHFRFDNVPPGVYQLGAEADGFKTIIKPDIKLPARAGEQPTELKIAMPVLPTDVDCWSHGLISYESAAGAGATLGGLVVDYDGKSKIPIANATVSLFRSETKISEQQTNERGEFDFKSIAPGQYLVVVTHPHYRDFRSRSFWVARQNQTRVTLDPIPADKIRVCA